MRLFTELSSGRHQSHEVFTMSRLAAAFRMSVVLVLCVATFCLHASRNELIAADDPNPEATRQYAVAYGFQTKKLYPQAIPRWTAFIQTFPQDPRIANANYQLGVCQLNDRKAFVQTNS